MTFLSFLLGWAALSVVVSFGVGRLIARQRLDGQPRHLLTARQAADAAGVSLATVLAWQDGGLIPTVRCPGCGRATIPVETVDTLAGKAAA